MMGFGYFGCGGSSGNSSTSISNLSASAPPFTVDRGNSKPNPKPVVHYSDARYNVEPFSDGCHFPHPSAPRSDLVMGSSGTATIPLSDYYQFSASASPAPSSTHWAPLNPVTNTTGNAFRYGGEPKPCYSPYAPPFYVDHSVVRDGEGSSCNDVRTSGQGMISQLDYTTPSFSHLEYGPQWVDGFGFDDGKRAKTMEFDRIFSPDNANIAAVQSYNNQRNDVDAWEASAVPYKKCLHLDDSGTQYQKLNDLFDREVQIASSIAGNIEDKSCLDGNLGCFPYYSNTMHIKDSCSTFTESESSKLEPKMGGHSTKQVYSSNSYGSYNGSFIGKDDKTLTGPVSVRRPSPTVVIRPPPALPSNSGRSVLHEKAAYSDIGEAICGLDSYKLNPLNRQDYVLNPSSEIREESFGGGILDVSEQGNYVFESTPLKEVSGSLHAGDTYADPNIKSRFRPQLPDLNISSNFTVAANNVQALKTSDDSVDLINHQNLAVDSPCWKGAPSSKFSQVHFGSSNPVKEALDDFHERDHEEHKIPCSVLDSRFVDFKKAQEIAGTNKTEYAPAVAGLDAISLGREMNLLEGEANVSVVTGRSSIGVEMSDIPNVMTNLINEFEVKVSDSKDLAGGEVSGISLNDVPGGGNVAIHAAEEVLASPVLREDASERITLPDPKLNVATMIKALHNISELLLLHVSDDSFRLEDENTEALQHIITNISSFLSKTNMRASEKPRPNVVDGDTCLKLRESRDLDTISGSLSMSTKGINLHPELHVQPPKLGEVKNCTFGGIKDERYTISSSLRDDDSEVTGDDDMGKAIKKVLEENFPFNEKMHSHAQLFWTLWLEAEAKLCSTHYKAHFNRMQIQMEDMKLKAPQEKGGNVKMNVHVSSSTIAPTELQAWKAHDGLDQRDKSQDSCIPGTGGHGNGIESSIMARYGILKSRDEIPKKVNMEVEDKAEIFDDNHADIVMARQNILKSREGSSDSEAVVQDKELQPKLVNGKFSGVKYLGPPGGNLHGETLVLPQTGIVDGSGCGYRDEFHLSIKEDLMIPSLKNAQMTEQNNCEWLDSSSSDWEHIRKDDFSGRNF